MYYVVCMYATYLLAYIGGRNCPMNYKAAVSGSSTVKVSCR